MNKKWIIIAGIVVVLIAFLVWLFIESSKPFPGQKIKDEGRGHVDIGTQVDYNSNPPTSGKHYADWVRSGFYSEPKDDRNLVHSLEHGYVIMSYNCDKQLTIDNAQWTKKKFSIFNFQFSINAYAHGIEEVATESAQTLATSSALPAAFSSEDCHKLVDQLIAVYEKRGKTRLIVVPRPNLDSRIALTAWNYIDKFNPSTSHSTLRDEPSGSDSKSSGLTVSEIERIEKFIDAHLNQGPEKTME